MNLQVIGTGLARTGTRSLKLALQQLTGKPCFHMIDLLENPERLTYLKERHKKGTTDWSGFYDSFGSAVDYPTCLYFEELAELNPKAKFIHTIRESESWYESVYSTVYRGVPKGPKDIVRLIFNSIRSKDMRRLAPVFMHNETIIWKGHFQSKFEEKETAIRIYQEHTEKVKRLIPKDRLLIFNIQDGWKPLCDFLELPIPSNPFPHSNAKNEFNRKMDKLLIHGIFEP